MELSGAVEQELAQVSIRAMRTEVAALRERDQVDLPEICQFKDGTAQEHRF